MFRPSSVRALVPVHSSESACEHIPGPGEGPTGDDTEAESLLQDKSYSLGVGIDIQVDKRHRSTLVTLTCLAISRNCHPVRSSSNSSTCA